MGANSWTFSADPEHVSAARGAVAAFAVAHAVPEPPLEDLKLAVTEAATNAVLHAFRRRPAPGTFTVTIEVAADGVVDVDVVDDGDGFARRDDSPGLGVGLPLIAKLATRSHVRTRPDGCGTQVRMRFVYDVAA